MSLKTIYAALEEFTEEVSSEIAPDQPTDGDFGEETAGVDFQQESGDIDSDLGAITQAAQGLEDIISLVEEAPGEATQPLQPFVEKAVNVALESNDMVQEAGNPVDSGTDKTKGQVLDKIKAFAKRVWEMLVSFGKKIAEWIRGVWAHMTDRIVRNSNVAKKILGQLASLQVGADAKITDKGLLTKIAAVGGAEVGETMAHVAEFVKDQGGKPAQMLTLEARSCVEAVAAGNNAEAKIEQFVKVLAKAAADVYEEDASNEQAQALKLAAGTKTVMSKPFFGGYRAWFSYPENGEALKLWNHGLSKVEEVKVADSVDAPNPDEIKAIAEFIIDLGTVVKEYQASLASLDALNKVLSSVSSKASEKTDRAQLQAMQAVIPRVIKGPQVAAYAYAATASTIALQYCTAGIRAHRGEKTVGEHASGAASKAGSAVRSGADKVSSAASGAKDKVKNAFGKKAE